MTTVVTALPLFGLRITAGPVELRGVTDDLIVPLAERPARASTIRTACPSTRPGR